MTDMLTDMTNIRMDKELGGGAFYDMACYNISAISYLLGMKMHPRGYYGVVGEKGRIEVPCNFNCRYVQKFTVTTEGTVENVEILDEKKTEYTVMCPDNYMLEIQQFGRCILEGESPLVSKEETLLNARILDQLLDQLANRNSNI